LQHILDIELMQLVFVAIVILHLISLSNCQFYCGLPVVPGCPV